MYNPITFFVSENGSGRSTPLEALANRSKNLTNLLLYMIEVTESDVRIEDLFSITSLYI